MRGRFQLDLLVGRRVYDSEGRELGRVDEVRVVREGARYEVEGLLIGVNGLAERLGVARPLERIEKRLNLRSWHTEDHIIYWEQIASFEGKAVRLTVPRSKVKTVSLDGPSSTHSGVSALEVRAEREIGRKSDNKREGGNDGKHKRS